MIHICYHPMSPATYHVIRLKPDQDLKKSLLDWARNQNMEACAIVTCVGSLKSSQLRLASGRGASHFPGPHEIVSLVGTFSKDAGHFHISIADRDGKVVGGHLLDENIIHTTAEIVIAELSGFEFKREKDPQTGYLELQIQNRKF